jgi:hypothetical protein
LATHALLLGQQVATYFSCADEPGGSGLVLCEGARDELVSEVCPPPRRSRPH